MLRKTAFPAEMVSVLPHRVGELPRVGRARLEVTRRLSDGEELHLARPHAAGAPPARDTVPRTPSFMTSRVRCCSPRTISSSTSSSNPLLATATGGPGPTFQRTTSVTQALVDYIASLEGDPREWNLSLVLPGHGEPITGPRRP